MKIKNPVNSPSAALLVTLWLWITPALVAAQGLDPASLLKPLSDSWPTYSGDYSGKRYSALTQINQSTVKNLTLAWVGRLTAGPAGAGAGGGGGGGGTATIIGGEDSADVGGGGTTIEESILQ